MSNQTIIAVPNGYGKKREIGYYRNPADVAELISHCSNHSHITFLSIDGTARTAKVNGKVRTWKRDPNRVEIPIKYGLYEYGTFTARDINRVLIPTLPPLADGSPLADKIAANQMLDE